MLYAIITYLIITACLIPFIGIGWALFSIIILEAGMILWNKKQVGKIDSRQEESLMATYCAIVWAVLSTSPWMGLMGYGIYQIYDMSGQIYLQVKCKLM